MCCGEVVVTETKPSVKPPPKLPIELEDPDYHDSASDAVGVHLFGMLHADGEISKDSLHKLAELTEFEIAGKTVTTSAPLLECDDVCSYFDYGRDASLGDDALKAKEFMRFMELNEEFLCKPFYKAGFHEWEGMPKTTRTTNAYASVNTTKADLRESIEAHIQRSRRIVEAKPAP